MHTIYYAYVYLSSPNVSPFEKCGEKFKAEDIGGGDQQHDFFITSELTAKPLVT